MSFKREIQPSVKFDSDELTSALISIGIKLKGKRRSKYYIIEDVIFSASIEGIIEEDYRVLSLLTDWISIHGRMINVDRLVKLVAGCSFEIVRRYWKAIAEWQSTDHRFDKMLKGARISGKGDLLVTGTDFMIRKNGEDERFKNSVLRVPRLTLRERLGDICTPEELSRINHLYRYRLIIGPSYRADLWAMLTDNGEQTPTELARSTYSSFATAWGVKRDFQIFSTKPV